MVNWGKYKITDVKERFDELTFFLDGYVSYRDSSQWIKCVNRYPFHDWKEDDCIEVDLDETKNHASIHIFNSENVLRKISSSTNIVSVSSSSSDIIVSPSAVNAMKSPEVREIAREMSRMVDDTGKEVEYKIQVENKDGKKISHSLILRKN